jgi:excisionase family DNA binding protein
MVALTTTEQLQTVLRAVLQEFCEGLMPTQSKEEKMLSVKEVAALLSVSTRSVIHYTRQGLLKSYRLGGSVRYKKAEALEAWKLICFGNR